jgi:hypothetical protein
MQILSILPATVAPSFKNYYGRLSQQQIIIIGLALLALGKLVWQLVNKKNRLVQNVRQSFVADVSILLASKQSITPLREKAPIDSQTVRLSDFFPQQEEANFKAEIAQLWRQPTNWDEQSLQRLNAAKEAVLQQAWQDYQITCWILKNGHFLASDLIRQKSAYQFIDEFLAHPYLLIQRPFGIILIPILAKLLQDIEKGSDKLSVLLRSKLQDVTYKQHLLQAIDFAVWQKQWSNGQKPQIYGTMLTVKISNSENSGALSLIRSGADINKYSPTFGNNPILLSIAKGWNHIDPRTGVLGSQKPIICELLNSHQLDINATHFKTGMTALHLACIRGDDIELIDMLLARGANPALKDYNGYTPLDLLDENYESAQKTVAQQTGGFSFWQENKCSVATLPSRQERLKNIAKIRQRLS